MPNTTRGHAETIEDVLSQLGARVDRALEEGSPLGYFPAVYRRVTLRVKQGIERGEFEDAARMDRMDTIFANRYLDAAAALDRGRPASASWALTWEAAHSWSPLVLQHLLLGMNAHINLDLGIAAVETAPGDELPGFHTDFTRINALLAELLDGVKQDLVAMWPLLGVFDRALGTTDDTIANFSMRKARDAAWNLAESLAPLGQDARRDAIAAADKRVNEFGCLLWHPGWVIQAPALVVRLTERGTVRKKIELLMN